MHSMQPEALEPSKPGKGNGIFVPEFGFTRPTIPRLTGSERIVKRAHTGVAWFW
jgi:hypothetical protein